ncbi:hypothetical protein C7387_4356 [Yokenella regensburgei]|uniref:Transposase n=1 Tax=Yokenella regensburgei TaxID=158877 RepID=A0AB38FW14_9ENTR|nr:hypothetical protein HMPREF0880_01523 [Yokenella regensburgei ATCC 43003]KAF1367259.1 hypothetical protein FHR25_004156 [Yokenella regensburgei]RKR52698.1 hypothetical protein C7387_4356 [Yokenella regensburgei]SQA62813.1 Uncharacterised protein [Yokenella regensburgei]SQB02371.1 Uncharacterised protein [Yokenella regensburgei]
MPQTDIKHEFFAIFAAKDLRIQKIARKSILWITLCIELL